MSGMDGGENIVKLAWAPDQIADETGVPLAVVLAVVLEVIGGLLG